MGYLGHQLEYVPIYPWGSTKLAGDDVTIYLPGELERSKKVGTDLVVSVEFKTDAQVWVMLRSVASALGSMKAGMYGYSLLGINCWAWSRFLVFVLSNSYREIVLSVRIPACGGFVTVEKLTEDLAISGGYFMKYAIWLMYEFNLLRRHTSLKPRTVLKSVAWHPLEILSGWILPAPKHMQFGRLKIVRLYPGITKDFMGNDCTESGLPHSIDPFGHAKDIDSNPYANSLCTAGDFLYLLTPALYLPAGHRISSVLVAAVLGHAVKMSLCADLSESWTWAECALVRRDPASNKLAVVSPRFNIPFLDRIIGECVHIDLLEEDHPILQAMQDGDMFGIWARGPGNGADQPSDWECGITAAGLKLTYQKVFKESRLDAQSTDPIDAKPVGFGERLASNLLGLSLWLVKPFASRRIFIEFGRNELVFVFADQTLDANGNECTLSGAHLTPSSSDQIANQRPWNYPSSISGPGYFLYLLTSPLDMPPDDAVLSLTIYTWSHDQGTSQFEKSTHGTYTQSQTWFFCTIVRRDEETGELQLGDTKEMHHNLHARDDRYYRQKYCIYGDHPLVRALQNGDRVGVWAMAGGSGWRNQVQKALIIIEFGRQRSLVARCAQLAHDMIVYDKPTIQDMMDRGTLWYLTMKQRWQNFPPYQQLRSNLLVNATISRYPKEKVWFVRSRRITVSETSGTLLSNDISSRYITTAGLPHSFSRNGLAIEDGGVSAYPNTLCGPGNFLYLLSAPLRSSVDCRIVSIAIDIWSHDQGRSRFPDESVTAENSPTWFECGLVRKGPPEQGIYVVDDQRFVACRNLPYQDDKYYEQGYQIDESHFVVRNCRDGDMIGLWARAEGAEWANHVEAATMVIKTEPTGPDGLWYTQ